ncbi:response regulator transcription factor [Bizionia argentinensis JUB59]|uniref:Response regulator transcription factor n=1 Tax=Bizionia argentinensis JUB59 TaxID=1046627 RepID=G2EAK3_9FLAO|nr:response regulator [Bizionia argentinensis]EGV44551.2 response regulator transcription factor [Bizionia argentinensis JUB59]
MSKTIRILMTDDHPMIIEGYQNTLIATKNAQQELEIDIANNCDESLEFMRKAVDIEQPYHVLFMDISLPPSNDPKFTSGEDLAKYARRIMPQCKIIMLTMFDEPYRIHNIIKDIDPEGFLIKSDLTSRELSSAFKAVLNNPPYYSGTVSSVIRKTITNAIHLDDIDRKILYLLSQGIRTKSLKDYFEISLSAIEKRKKQLKITLDVPDGSDEKLLALAKKEGFI